MLMVYHRENKSFVVLCFPAVVVNTCSCYHLGFFFPVLSVAHVCEKRPAKEVFWSHVWSHSIWLWDLLLRFQSPHNFKGGNKSKLSCKTLPALTFFS